MGMRIAVIAVGVFALGAGCARPAAEATPDAGTLQDLAFPPVDSGMASPQLCSLSCSAASDCGESDTSYPADAFRCRAGACEFVGCTADEDCAAWFGGPGYAPVCGPRGYCGQRCTDPAECVDSSRGPVLGTLRNARCDGTCYWVCETDSDCVAEFGDALPFCRSTPRSGGLRGCVAGCASDADCDGFFGTGALGLCRDGACDEAPCTSDAMCSRVDVRSVCGFDDV